MWKVVWSHLKLGGKPLRCPPDPAQGSAGSARRVKLRRRMDEDGRVIASLSRVDDHPTQIICIWISICIYVNIQLQKS